jgi:hypothetical protein
LNAVDPVGSETIVHPSFDGRLLLEVMADTIITPNGVFEASPPVTVTVTVTVAPGSGV